jgi:Ni/Co efflux regulator RcnB
MKMRLATAALAALTFAAPLAVTTEAAAQHRGRGDNHGRWDRDRDRDGRRHDRRGDRRDDRYDRRDHRDDRRHQRWDRSRYNGYNYNGRWYYGPPPANYGYVDYGYRAWRRGDRLPAYYRDYYRPVDYRYYRLRPPPRGYHYVRDDRGDYLLIGIATGVILGIIASQ